MISTAPDIGPIGVAQGPCAEATSRQPGLEWGGTTDGVYTMWRDLQALLGRQRTHEDDRRLFRPVNRERNR